MSAAWVSSSVRLPDFVRTATSGWTLAIAGGFVLCTSVLLGFVYWRAAAHMTSTINGSLTDGLRAIAENPAAFEQYSGFVRGLPVDAARTDHEQDFQHKSK